jgi:hypothetical protein
MPAAHTGSRLLRMLGRWIGSETRVWIRLYPRP